MKTFYRLFPLFLSSYLLTGCGDDNELSNREKRLAEDRFFSSAAVASLKDFKNEAENFPTDYLKLYKDDPIAWQPWDQSIQEKASNCQTPILLFVVSAVNGNCRDIVSRIYENETILNLLRDNNLCSIGDIHANPELGLLAHSLSMDSRQEVSFPFLIWLSHEKLPIASFSIGTMEEKQIQTAVTNAATMVEDIWNNSSGYAVSNSRADNESRQKRIDLSLKGELPPQAEKDDALLPAPSTRNEIYRNSTRKIISLYDPLSRNFDRLGGILPASALELTGTATLSPRFTTQVRAAARTAFKETTDNIIHSPAQDILANGYFQAKRSSSGDLPVFSKRLETQTQFASALLIGGQATGNQDTIQEGLKLADHFRAQIKSGLHAAETSLNNTDTAGHYLWSWEVLSQYLNEEELRLFSKVYRIRKFGNISASTDPTGKFFKLNSLAQSRPLEEIASDLGLPADSLRAQLSPLRAKLLAIREQNSEMFRESLISASQLASLGKVFCSAWAISNEQQYLDSATTLGEKLISSYQAESASFTRFPAPIPLLARGEDFSVSALFFISLYQATLDEKWLIAARKTTKEALGLLAREDFPLQECQKKDRIIPIYIHNSSMIFSESTTGIFDQIYTRFQAISPDEQFATRRINNTLRYRINTQRMPIIHTDLLRSFALGDQPYLIALAGDQTSPATQAALRQLNDARFTSFATIASASLTGLNATPNLSTPAEGISIGLYQNGKLLAQAEDVESFAEIFASEMAKKE